MVLPRGAGRVDARVGTLPAAAGSSSLENELGRLDQALCDLKICEGSEVALVRCVAPDVEQRLVGALTARALRRGFATAALSLAEHGLEALDGLVRAVVQALQARQVDGRGLSRLVGAFAARHPRDAGAAFGRAAERWGAVGDLSTLCCRFGELPEAERARVAAAAEADIERYAERVLSADNLAAVLD